MPKYRLQVVLANTPGEFLTRHLQWGSEPIVGDGFAPRRDNFIVMSAKPRLSDPLFQEFDTLLSTKLAEVNVKVQPFGVNVTRDDLLSGKVNESKFARLGAVPLAYAQVAVLLSKTLEDEAERCLTVTNEAVRQLLIAAEVFPRHVQIPDWMVEGLAAFFETPPGLYPNVGSKSWTHLVSYKYLRNTKDRRLENPTATLFNVVTDRYFRDARMLSANLRQSPNNNDFRLASRDAWELARCTSWAYVYYLAQTGKLDSLFQYGKEFDKLPRDMDFSDLVVQGCFARAFGMTDNADPRRIDATKLASTASAWSGMMQETNLDSIDVQTILLEMRAKQENAGDEAPAPPATGPNASGPTPPSVPTPLRRLATPRRVQVFARLPRRAKRTRWPFRKFLSSRREGEAPASLLNPARLPARQWNGRRRVITPTASAAFPNSASSSSLAGFGNGRRDFSAASSRRSSPAAAEYSGPPCAATSTRGG